MSERALFIYIAAVLILTVIPIDGQSVTCNNANFRLINGLCYGVLPGEVDWTKAKDTCTSLNGKLATFASLDEMATVFTSLDIPLTEAVLVGTPREAQETGDFWSGDWQTGSTGYLLQRQICKEILLPTYSRRSVCMEIDNSTPTNNPITTSTPPIPKERCLLQDSILFDGQCYHLSFKWFTWLDAKQYCESFNGKVATIFTVEQGMKILKPFGNTWDVIWAITNPLKPEVPQFVRLNHVVINCYIYQYGQSLADLQMTQVLCME